VDRNIIHAVEHKYASERKQSLIEVMAHRSKEVTRFKASDIECRRASRSRFVIDGIVDQEQATVPFLAFAEQLFRLFPLRDIDEGYHCARVLPSPTTG
jgi:hypothetical protein